MSKRSAEFILTVSDKGWDRLRNIRNRFNLKDCNEAITFAIAMANIMADAIAEGKHAGITTNQEALELVFVPDEKE